MAFQALKNSCDIIFRPITSFDDLAIGIYSVDSFALKSTVYGKRIFVNITDFCVVLPPRFLERINKQSQIDDLNEDRYKMIYNGKDRTKKNLLLLNFEKVVEKQKSSTSAMQFSDETDGSSLRRTADESNRQNDEEQPAKKTQRKKNTPRKFL